MKTAKIANLDRVTLQIEAGRTESEMDITPMPVEYTFIYGLGAGGLTGFEFALAELQQGDSIQLHIQTHEIDKYFEHIQLPVFRSVLKLPFFYLKALIKDIQKAEPREVIKAMAAITACGCGCGGEHDHIFDGDPESNR